MGTWFGTWDRYDRVLPGDRYWRLCPTCNGSGVNPRLPTHVCPKCQGERKVPRA